MDGGLAEHDPYRGMSTGKDSIRPSFLNGLFGEKRGEKEQTNAKAAKDGLKSAENVAGQVALGKAAGNLGSVRESEQQAGGLFSGIGKSKNQKEEQKGVTGKIAKTAPAIGIIVALFAFGFTAFSGLSTELIAWKENIYSMFGQNSAVLSTRGNFLMLRLLSPKKSGSGTTDSGIQYKIKPSLAKKLNAQGIEYIDDADGKGLRLLAYKDAEGNYTPIVASEYDKSRANALAGKEFEVDGKKIKLGGQSMTLTEARKVNGSFETSYKTATISFTGKIAGWFDSSANSLLKRIVGPNARNQTDIEDPDEESVKKTLLSNVSEGADDSEVDIKREDADEDENRKPVSDEVVETEDGKAKTIGEIESEDGKLKVDSGTSSGGTKSIGAALTARAQKAAMSSATVGCAFLRGIGAISIAIGAAQTSNVISYASKYLELADKSKAGDADETVNIALDLLNTRYKTDTKVDDREIPEGSVTESDGWNAPFAATNIVDENDPSALMVNREQANKIALQKAVGTNVFSDLVSGVSGFGAGITAFKYCMGFQVVSGIIDGVSDIALLLSTAGIGNALKQIVKSSYKGAKFALAFGLITTVVTIITPMTAKWFAGTLADAFLGLNGGYALLSGAQNIMESNLQMSTGRFADETNVMEVAALTKNVEREWAEYERATKSPFDLTSKYTFLGSIYNSALPIINSSSGTATSAVSSLVSLAGSSAVALVSPSVSAAGEINNRSIASGENCNYLHSVGAAGDFACNKYTGAYVDKLNTEAPEDISARMVKYDSFDGEDSSGNPKVRQYSKYANFIVACIASDTQPGTVSATVQGYIGGAYEKVTGGNAVANGLLNLGANFIPVEGLLEAADGAEQFNNLKWNSGLACTGNTGDAEFDKMIEDFSMYNLDQRVLQAMGVIETNSTTAFLEEYYKENPLDNSFEGQIARISGMTREEVEDTLGLIEYYQFLAQYDPLERYAFGAPAVRVEEELRFDNDNQLANTYFILLNEISFADVRNRSFAV